MTGRESPEPCRSVSGAHWSGRFCIQGSLTFNFSTSLIDNAIPNKCNAIYIILLSFSLAGPDNVTISFPCLMYFQSKNSSSYYYLNLISYTFSNKKKNKKIVDINLYVDNHKVYECTSCTLHIIYFFIQAALDEATEPWGIKVERVEM